MRPEEVFTVLCTSPFSRVGREPRWGNVGRPGVSAQSECETLEQKNQAYARKDHHDEGVGCNQSV
jgi:hypothetical protein